MVNEHLNDDQIQEFLDGSLPIRDNFDVQQHLKNCHVCRETVASYQELYDVLVEDKGMALSKNFTRKVLRQTHKHAVGAVQFGLMQVFFGLATLIVAVNVWFYYADMTAVKNSAKSTATAFTSFLPQMSEQYANMSSQVQFNGVVTALAAAALLCLFLLDRLILQPRFKTSH